MTSDTVVILVNYKGACDTEKCLKSLQASTEIPFVIVVDNTPNDPDLKKIVDSYKDAHLIRAPENIGFGRGNNLGIRWALLHDYSYIFILNNDAQVKSDTIEKLKSEMQQCKTIGITTPRIVLSENPNILWYGGGDVNYWRGRARVPGFMGPSNTEIVMKPREVTFASGCSMFVNRKVFETIGGFDPRFFMYEEDLELCLRAVENNYKIRYIPDAIVEHIGQGSMRDEDREKFVGALHPENKNLTFYAYHFTRNRLLNMYIHARGISLVMFILGFCFTFTYKVTQYIINKRTDGALSMLKGFMSFIKVTKKSFVNELDVGYGSCMKKKI
ncbi:MAG TPA: glycosyltransferase family 2 protein [Ignavibacteria bacterium]|nr:glycosyltransferase family 2 protein [Ignavibacteria bacterium]